MILSLLESSLNKRNAEKAQIVKKNVILGMKVANRPVTIIGTPTIAPHPVNETIVPIAMLKNPINFKKLLIRCPSFLCT